jgi:hypothetical protein
VVTLPRLHLFELNDQPWLPAAARDTIVESLSRTLAWGRMLDGLVGPFLGFLDTAGATEVLDLGAGAGGPARILVEAMKRAGRTPPRFLLTDLHPRPEVWEALRAAHPDALEPIVEPVDATRIPPALGAGRARCVINVLHHFTPPLARAVFEDAVRAGAGIFVAEGFARNPLQFLNFAVAGLPALLLNPILSPKDRLLKAALTWLTPAALAMALWDGIVSTLRVYSEDELRAMVAPFGAGYDWVYGTFRYLPRGEGTFFYGTARRAGPSG